MNAGTAPLTKVSLPKENSSRYAKNEKGRSFDASGLQFHPYPTLSPINFCSVPIGRNSCMGLTGLVTTNPYLS